MVDGRAAFSHKGHLDKQTRRRDQRVRTGMHLAQRTRTAIMSRKAQNTARRPTSEFQTRRIAGHIGLLAPIIS
jgi:hypothetical protein